MPLSPARLLLIVAATSLAACGSDPSDPLAPSSDDKSTLAISGTLMPRGVGGGGGGGTAPENPDAAYLAATTKLDISGIANFTSVSSVTDANLTASFSPTLDKYTVGSTWNTWSSPPFAEEAQPHVLFTNGANTLTIDLSRDVSTFGLEVEGNGFGVVTYTAFFYNNGGSLVASVVRPVDGSAGARLFASNAFGIRRIVVTATVGNPGGFAVAQLRYATGGLLSPCPMARDECQPTGAGGGPLTPSTPPGGTRLGAPGGAGPGAPGAPGSVGGRLTPPGRGV